MTAPSVVDAGPPGSPCLPEPVAEVDGPAALHGPMMVARDADGTAVVHLAEGWRVELEGRPAAALADGALTVLTPESWSTISPTGEVSRRPAPVAGLAPSALVADATGLVVAGALEDQPVVVALEPDGAVRWQAALAEDTPGTFHHIVAAPGGDLYALGTAAIPGDVLPERTIVVRLAADGALLASAAHDPLALLASRLVIHEGSLYAVGADANRVPALVPITAEAALGEAREVPRPPGYPTGTLTAAHATDDGLLIGGSLCAAAGRCEAWVARIADEFLVWSHRYSQGELAWVGALSAEPDGVRAVIDGQDLRGRLPTVHLTHAGTCAEAD